MTMTIGFLVLIDILTDLLLQHDRDHRFLSTNRHTVLTDLWLQHDHDHRFLITNRHPVATHDHDHRFFSTNRHTNRPMATT